MILRVLLLRPHLLGRRTETQSDCTFPNHQNTYEAVILGGQFLVSSVALTSFFLPIWDDEMTGRLTWPILTLPAYCFPLVWAGHLWKPTVTPLIPFSTCECPATQPGLWSGRMAEQSRNRGVAWLRPGAESSQTRLLVAISLSVLWENWLCLELHQASSTSQRGAWADKLCQESNLAFLMRVFRKF